MKLDDKEALLWIKGYAAAFEESLGKQRESGRYDAQTLLDSARKGLRMIALMAETRDTLSVRSEVFVPPKD